MTMTNTTKATKATSTKAAKVSPTAAKNGSTSASKVTSTSTKATTAEIAERGRVQRMKDALNRGKGLSLAEVAVAIGTAEVAVEAVKESEKAITERLAGIVTDRKAKAEAFAKTCNLMERLAAELNPNLTAPTTGRNAAREAVNAAVVIALAISKDAAKKRVARWVMAGSLHIAHGTPMAQAYTSACNASASGEVAAFWAIVAAPVTASTPGPVTRKPSTASNKGTKGTAPAAPVTVEAATKVVTEAKAAKVAAMTPAQRGAELLSDFLKSYGALVDALKSGEATLTKAQETRRDTALKAISAA